MMNFSKKNKRIGLIIFTFSLVFILLFMNSIIPILFKTKVLVHRVNSIEKLNNVKNKFIGVELDLVYEKIENKFDVNHPPAPSINLNLRDFLTHSKSMKNFIYWLDFKNIDSSNTKKSLNELNKIVANLKISRKQIIVESSFPKFISNFKKAGYKTSYYLPPYLYSKSKDSLDYYIKNIELQTKSHPTTYISFDYLNYSIISHKFPHLKKLSWYSDQNGIIAKLNSKILIYKILFDDNVDFFLLPHIIENIER